MRCIWHEYCQVLLEVLLCSPKSAAIRHRPNTTKIARSAFPVKYKKGQHWRVILYGALFIASFIDGKRGSDFASAALTRATR
jgi:hypothetical protein